MNFCRKKSPVVIGLSALRSFFMLLLTSFLTCMSSCNLFMVEKHRAIRFGTADFLFCDTEGQNYFFLDSLRNDRLLYCNDNSINYWGNYHYRQNNFYIENGNSNRFSPNNVTVNPDYVIICGWDFTSNSGNKILFFDKSLSFQKAFYYDSSSIVEEMICTEKSLYSVVKKRDIGLTELHRLNLATFEDDLLLSDMRKTNHYIDEDFTLFYNSEEIDNLGYYCNKTMLLEKYDKSIKDQVYFTDRTELFIDKDSLCIVNDGKTINIENVFGISKLYRKAYIQDNKLIFAGLNYQPNKECFTYEENTVLPCLCGLKESFLFYFDLGTNKLFLLNEYPDGTFLIDYDLETTQYYYDGGLYVDNSFIRSCEKAKIGPLEKFYGSYKPEYDLRRHYLCFHEGEFYGI